LRDGGRLSAAIEVVEEVFARRRPVRLALKAWGEGARYAGARDRACVSGLVLDVLRRRRSLGWMMGDDGAGSLVLGAARHLWRWGLDRLDAAVGDDHGPGNLSHTQRERLETPLDLEGAEPPVRGDYADWMDEPLMRIFAETRVAEAAALAQRAPLDLRVNTLRADDAGTLEALAPFGARPTALRHALRIDPPAADARAAPVEAAPEFEEGWFEVQDLGSQIAAGCAGDIAGRQVLDLCAGGGGKTLAMAAAMGGSGQIFAFDRDARRLTDTVRRARRAGVTNLEVRSPIHAAPLAGLEGRMDVVFVDAPCTGSGTWRRHPDAKWRLTPQQLARRIEEQDRALDDAARYVRPGGRVVYVTCSLFAEENEDRVCAFLGRHPGFRTSPIGPKPLGRQTAEGWLRLTPLADGTDGFFIAVLASPANLH
jgi:16S rRNA (cytosine967-C5)-methyltransferase